MRAHICTYMHGEIRFFNFALFLCLLAKILTTSLRGSVPEFLRNAELWVGAENADSG